MNVFQLVALAIVGMVVLSILIPRFVFRKDWKWIADVWESTIHDNSMFWSIILMVLFFFPALNTKGSVDSNSLRWGMWLFILFSFILVLATRWAHRRYMRRTDIQLRQPEKLADKKAP